ncbi:MAG TPA: ribosomal protein S18-alanine N-acetyltransferase [Caldimonas sp.]|nr:ribosomal protein S18-alanine N-acetyltransferase [Caldimonas sp.]
MSGEFAQRAVRPGDATLRAMTVSSLDGVVELETNVYPFPWSRGNFVDSLAAGYTAWTLNGPGGELIGYCIAMRGVDEMHLLNITIAPPARRRGHARRLLAELVRHCRHEGAHRLWLEVREGNAVARATYLRLGFAEVGTRRAYYPAPAGRREDAVVMGLDLNDDAGAADALD